MKQFVYYDTDPIKLYFGQSMSWLTKSNSFFKSPNEPTTTFFLLRDDNKLFRCVKVAISVDNFSQKLNCSLTSILLLFKWQYSL